MRIWPWSTINRLKKEVCHYQIAFERQRFYEQFYKAKYYKLLEANRGAHKGIRRLKQKLKKATTPKVETGNLE